MADFPVPKAFRQSARLLDGLADQNRIRILWLLGSEGRMSVRAISGHFTMSRPAISHHLKVMLDSGLVLNEKSGQEVYYWVACDNIVRDLRVLADAIEYCCRDQSCCLPTRKSETRKRRIQSNENDT